MNPYRNSTGRSSSGASYGSGQQNIVPSRQSVPSSYSPSTSGTKKCAGPSPSASARQAQNAYSYGASNYGGNRSYSTVPPLQKKKKRWPVLIVALLLIIFVAVLPLVLDKNASNKEEIPTISATAFPATISTTDQPAVSSVPVPSAVPEYTSLTEEEFFYPAYTEALPSSVASSQPTSSLFHCYDVSLRWYLFQLTPEEQALFAFLYDAIDACEETIKLPHMQYTKEQLERAVRVLTYDCPELVHLDTEAGYSYRCIYDLIDTVQFTYAYENAAENRNISQHVLNEVAGLLNEAESQLPAAQLEYELYLRILQRATYDKEYEFCSNADSVFLYGKAKCSGFASAFNLACRYYGLPSIYAVGDAFNGTVTESHEWNYVQIDGEWYICDPTWDQPVYSQRSSSPAPLCRILRYFNVTSAQVKDSHFPEQEYAKSVPLPVCTSVNASIWKLVDGITEVYADEWKQTLFQELDAVLHGRKELIFLRFVDAENMDINQEVYSACVKEWAQNVQVPSCSYTILLQDEDGFLMLYNFEYSQAESFPPADELQVRFFDVGDADAAFVSCNGHHMLIDGGTEKSGSRLLYSHLEKNRISFVDAIIVTHPHSDHAGGLNGALSYENCQFGTLYSSVKSSDNKSFNTLLEKAAQRGLQPVVPDIGFQFLLGEATVTFVSPEAYKRYENVNNGSLVVRIDYGNTSFLFTGDAMENAEIDMLRSNQNLRANVLKVAHHGANTSSSEDFLRAVAPDIAIISCEKGHASHPSDETLSRLKHIGALVLRTDQHGSITIYSDGQNLSYTTE